MCKINEEAKKLFAKIKEFKPAEQKAICEVLYDIVKTEKEALKADLQKQIEALDRDLTPEERGFEPETERVQG